MNQPDPYSPETDASFTWQKVAQGDCGILARFWDVDGDFPTYGLFSGWDDETVLCNYGDGRIEHFLHAEKQVLQDTTELKETS